MVIENMQKFKLLGKVVGKAVFDRIPVNLAFCRPLLRAMLDQKVELEDIKLYDSQVPGLSAGLLKRWIALWVMELFEESGLGLRDAGARLHSHWFKVRPFSRAEARRLKYQCNRAEQGRVHRTQHQAPDRKVPCFPAIVPRGVPQGY